MCVFVVTRVLDEDIAQLLTITKAEVSLCMCVCVFADGWVVL